MKKSYAAKLYWFRYTAQKRYEYEIRNSGFNKVKNTFSKGFNKIKKLFSTKGSK